MASVVGFTKLYELVDSFGKAVKWGITWNPKARHTNADKARMGFDRMKIIGDYPDRKEARRMERMLEENVPGPKNRTPWPGSKEVPAVASASASEEGRSPLIDILQFVADLADPIFGAINAAVHLIIEKVVDPFVERVRANSQKAFDRIISPE